MLVGLLATGGLVGCEKSINEEQQDVRDAQRDAAENVAEEKSDVDAARREGAQEVREEQRDVQEAVDEAKTNP
jgi:hypothetical protein